MKSSLDGTETGCGSRSVTSARLASRSAKTWSQRARLASPKVVARLYARSIQAGFAAQSEHVLHRNHREAGNGSLSRADECPVDSLFAMSNVSRRSPALVFGCARIPPAQGRVIVMGAGVDHTIWSEPVRQIYMAHRRRQSQTAAQPCQECDDARAVHAHPA